MSGDIVGFVKTARRALGRVHEELYYVSRDDNKSSGFVAENRKRESIVECWENI